MAVHDGESEYLVDDGWAFRHFRDSVGEGGVDFNYRVHAGLSSTPNALRLLEASG